MLAAALTMYRVVDSCPLREEWEDPDSDDECWDNLWCKILANCIPLFSGAGMLALGAALGAKWIEAVGLPAILLCVGFVRGTNRAGADTEEIWRKR